jgi:tellurite resistance protein TehA-like permease
MNWGYGLFWYALMIVSTIAILRLPLYIRRPAAMGVIMLAILVNYYFLPPVVGFEWFIPALFLKIVYGHIVREEPYRE